MKKRKRLCLLLSAVLLLAGCGGGDSGEMQNNTESGAQAENGDGDAVEKGLYDFAITEETIALPIQAGEALRGAQYFEGERIWLLGNWDGQVFCYREGNGERELLLEHIPAACLGHTLYRAGENFYAYQMDKLTVLDAEGEEVCSLYAEGRIISLCESRNGSIVLAIESGNGVVLKTLDMAGYTLSGSDTISDCIGIGTGIEQEILVVDRIGVYDLDMESGEKNWHMKWNGTAYSPSGGRFWYAAELKEDGSLEQIESSADTFYVVGLQKIYPEEEGKTPLILRTLSAESGLKQLVAEFNKKNGEYHIFLQDNGEEYGLDFRARNDMEIATGNGPDLIVDSAVSDMQALAVKGALENLEPYLEQSGIHREDYHPETFQNRGMEEGIYSVGYEMYVQTLYIREELLDGGQTGIEVLLDNMESYDGQMVFNKMLNYTPAGLLGYFFQMSDDFYGMVDWEGKTCDFSGELWEQVLRVAKQYGLTDRNRAWEEAAGWGGIQGFSFMVRSELDAEQYGRKLAGYPSENGMVHKLLMNSIAINAASVHKEGAWQFIQFLLEEENQKLVLRDLKMPVHEEVLAESVQEDLLLDYFDPGSHTKTELPEGIEEKFWECLDNAKPASYRTEQVLAIIREEAEFYFAGDKSIEEVSAVIENRVRLYLAEQE